MEDEFKLECDCCKKTFVTIFVHQINCDDCFEKQNPDKL